MRALVVGAISVLLLFGFTACGYDDGDSDTLTPRASPQTATPAAEPGVAASTRMDLRVTVEGGTVCESDAAGDPVTCVLDEGQEFALAIVPSTMPDRGTEEDGYGAWASLIDFGSLLYLGANRPAAEDITWDLSSLPLKSTSGHDPAKSEDGSATGSSNCDDGVDNDNDGLADIGDPDCATRVQHADTSSLFAPFPLSTQEAPLVKLDFSCTVSGVVALISKSLEFPNGAAYKGVNAGEDYVPDVGSLQINCGGAG